jgi:hypothetical protein
LLRLVYENEIRHVTVDGIAHVPVDVLDEYRVRASQGRLGRLAADEDLDRPQLRSDGSHMVDADDS